MMQQAVFDTAQWLTQCHSNGAELDLKELLYYKSKAHLLSLKPKKRIQSSQGIVRAG